VEALRGFTPSTLNHKPSTYPATTILAGGPSAYGGGRGGHFRGLPTRFFFSPGFFRVSFLVEKVAKPL
jgi:hypothetical protein